MKYMGSKRLMLKNGLGDLIRRESKSARRVVDLFCGAGSVSWFIARNTQLPVLAVDLQEYAVVLARAVITRTDPIDVEDLIQLWLLPAQIACSTSSLWNEATALEESITNPVEFATQARQLCSILSDIGPIWNAYGGHYFSPQQALVLDYLIRYLPVEDPARTVCLASIISAASQCAAAPGHTAQPFKPNTRAGRFLLAAWRRSVLSETRKALLGISSQHAQAVGEGLVADALDLAAHLRPDDLVLVDPPYSGVQYSRFYHVLETIARGYCSGVEGIGRYPRLDERPQSSFSNKGQSKQALDKLLSLLSSAGSTVILTFPSGECSNGLSGGYIAKQASNYFEISEMIVKGQFSTLGGNNGHRAPRTASSELILLMEPPTRSMRNSTDGNTDDFDVHMQQRRLIL